MIPERKITVAFDIINSIGFKQEKSPKENELYDLAINFLAEQFKGESNVEETENSNIGNN